MIELWKPIPGWPNYAASNLGRIKRLECHSVLTGKLLLEKILKRMTFQEHKNSNHITTKVHLGYYKNQKCVSVGRLVLLAFVGLPKVGEECRHLDDDQTNCKLTNLEWGTKQQNKNDSMRNGKHAKGSIHGNALFTENMIIYLRNIYVPYSSEYGLNALANRFEINKSTLAKILYKKTWKHV